MRMLAWLIAYCLVLSGGCALELCEIVDGTAIS